MILTLYTVLILLTIKSDICNVVIVVLLQVSNTGLMFMKIHKQHLKICIMQLFQGLGGGQTCKKVHTVMIFDGYAGGLSAICSHCY
jgi:hypothetical protein